MINDAIQQLIHHEDLTFEQTKAVHDEIMGGQVEPVLLSSYLTALASQGVTPAEMAGAADAMREHALAFNAPHPVLEIVGTGGDHSNSFNVSTTTMFVIAAAGVRIAKHGNRAASSQSGAADVLEALGVDINAPVEESELLLERENLAFLFAQKYHEAMRFVGPTRKLLGFPTIFNLIGPLSNPAKPDTMLLGVYQEALLDPMAEALRQLGVQRALVVHGRDGLDEITVTTPSDALMLADGEITRLTIDPADYGIDYARPADLVGGTPEVNANITRDILSGEERGAKTDAVILNAGAALMVAGAVADIAEGMALARTVLANGSAADVLKRVIARQSSEVTA